MVPLHHRNKSIMNTTALILLMKENVATYLYSHPVVGY